MSKTGERKAPEWLYQRISVTVMHDSAASIKSCTSVWVKVHPHFQSNALVHKVVVRGSIGSDATYVSKVGAGSAQVCTQGPYKNTTAATLIVRI